MTSLWCCGPLSARAKLNNRYGYYNNACYESMKAYVVDCAPHAFPFCSFSISRVGDSGDLPLCRQKSNASQSGTGHFSCQTRKCSHLPLQLFCVSARM